MEDKIIMLSRKIKAGSYSWQPKTLSEAMTMIKHLQNTIKNKDKRINAIADSEAATQRENELLYDRITDLKKFMHNIGVKTV